MITRTLCNAVNETRHHLETAIEKTQQLMSFDGLLNNDVADEKDYDLVDAIKQFKSALMMAQHFPEKTTQQDLELIKKAQLINKTFLAFLQEYVFNIHLILETIAKTKDASEEEILSILSKNPLASKMLSVNHVAIPEETSTEQFSQSRQLCYTLMKDLGIFNKNNSLSSSKHQPELKCQIRSSL